MYYVTAVKVGRKTRRFIVTAPKDFVAASILNNYLNADVEGIKPVKYTDMHEVNLGQGIIYEIP